MRTVKLGEICEFRYGKNLPQATRVAGDYPVYGSNGQVGWHNEHITTGPAIVVGRKGSIGELHFSDKPCWPIDTTYFIDRDCTSVDLRWLYHTLFSLRLTELNKATGVPGLNRNDAYDKSIFVPTPDEQGRIAAILDKAANVRNKCAQALALADQFIRGAFVERFGDPVSNAKGLPVAPVKHLALVVTGNTPPRKDLDNYGPGIEWIKSDNIDSRFHFLTKAEETLSSKGRSIGRIVPAGSTLITCIAGSPNSIGNAALADREVAFNQQINAAIPRANVDPLFLYCQFLLGKRLIQNASTNSMKGMVSKGKFQEIQFLSPPFEEQRRFGCLFQKLIHVSNSLRDRMVQSETLRGGLEQRASQGEL